MGMIIRLKPLFTDLETLPIPGFGLSTKPVSLVLMQEDLERCNTLYILFLRYPEGINADELWRYWDELCKIYGSQMIYDDRSLIEDAVEGICDEEKVTWYTNVSRIKRKITDKLGKRAAEQYIIRRGEDGLYRISARQM